MPKRDAVKVHGRSAIPAFALCLILGSIGAFDESRAANPSRTAVRETFSGRDFDRSRWTLSNVNLLGVRVDFARGTMHIIVPPGPNMRPLVGFKARFGLEGDFRVSADYTVRSLPRPEKEWTNLSIFVSGADGAAAVIRTNHSTAGSGYGLWFQPVAGSTVQGKASQVPTEDRAGTLQIERVGRELRFSVSGRGHQFSQIGAADFGDHPINEIVLHVLAPGLKTPVDIELDNITVEADRLTGLIHERTNGFSPLPWILAFLGIAALVLLLLWHSKRGRRRLLTPQMEA